MGPYRIVAAVIFLILVCGARIGAQLSSPKLRSEEIVEEIFELDGTREEQEHEAEAREYSLKQSASRRPLTEVAAQLEFNRIMFGGPEFAMAYKHAFLESLDQAKALEVLNWLRSPTIAKLYAMARELNLPGGLERQNEFMRSPEGRRRYKESQAILQHYAEMTRCGESSHTVHVDGQAYDEGIGSSVSEISWRRIPSRVLPDPSSGRHRQGSPGTS